MFEPVADSKFMLGELAHLWGASALYRLLEKLPAGAYTCDDRGLITYYNPRAVELWGREPRLNHPQDRFCGSFKLYAPDGTPLCHEECWMALALREEADFDGYEILIERPDGSRVTALAHASPVHDADGTLLGAINVLVDITDRKLRDQTALFLSQASATLSELTDYESALHKIAGIAVPFFADWCAVDMCQPDGSVRRLAVTHLDPAKVQLAHDLHRRYPPKEDDAHGVMKVLRTGEPEWVPSISETLLTEAAHDEEHLRITRELGLSSYICVPMRARDRILGVLTFVTAESGRKYDERDLNAAEDLAGRAAIAIENALLLDTLKETNQRKDEFLAILAHELRNPLAPVRNAVHILRTKGPKVDELEQARDMIDRQIEQMTRLVDDLLDLSRINTDKIELQKERVTLAEIVAGVIEDSRPVLEAAGIEHMDVDLPPAPIYLEVDPTRFAQVLLNLLHNAAKYNHAGGRVALTAAQEGEVAVIRVEDDGIGIAPEVLPRIFDMFTQADRSLERSQGGLGIGLTLVKRLVELHDGTIEAQSEGLGRGSAFVLRLPTVSAGAPCEEGSATEDSEAEPAARRILVVDDNRDAADSLKMLLEMSGHEVVTAYDGKEALEVAKAFVPDIVLLDIGLPRLNGYDAAGHLRQERGDEITLIAVTGWGQDDDRRRSREAGFDHHLTKPVNPDALKRLLADLEQARAT